MTFYWNDEDKKDQEQRRQINASVIYSDEGSCDVCRAPLHGYCVECSVCGALLCPLHSCVDGRCPEHTGGEQTASDE